LLLHVDTLPLQRLLQYLLLYELLHLLLSA